jgi:hypothetical protein
MENKHKLVSKFNKSYTQECQWTGQNHPTLGCWRQRPDEFQKYLVVCTWIGIEVKQYPSSSSSS